MSTGHGTREKRVTTRALIEMKARGEKIVVLTAYDYTFARLVDESGADVVLVGDSVGQCVLGYDSTIPVTIEEMIHHGRAVRRGVSRALLVVDMPFLSFHVAPPETVRNAGRILKETGAEAVKLEGGDEEAAVHVRALVRAGIPVMGHLGLTPQSVHAIGGYRVQGRGEAAATRLKLEAIRLQEAGCFSVVLELIPAELGGEGLDELQTPGPEGGRVSSVRELPDREAMVGYGHRIAVKPMTPVRQAMAALDHVQNHAERLHALGVVAVNGDRFQPQLPGLGVGVHDLLDGGLLGHVDGLRDGAGDEGLHRRHHLHVAHVVDGALADRAVEHRVVLGLHIGRADHRVPLVHVRDDLLGLSRRVAELVEGHRHRLVHDRDLAAAHELLRLDEREVGLDPGRVAIHHEADRPGRREHRRLRVPVPVQLPEVHRIVPRPLRGLVQVRRHVPRVDVAHGVAMLAHHPEERLPVLLVPGERAAAVAPDPRRGYCQPDLRPRQIRSE